MNRFGYFHIQRRSLYAQARQGCFLLLLCVLGLGLGACAPTMPSGQKGISGKPQPVEKEVPAATLDISSLPATYRGKLPCADCQGIGYHLNLKPDHAFTLRRTYMGIGKGHADRDIVDSGRWDISPDATVLTLYLNGSVFRKFRAVTGGCLHMLDNTGGEIRSDLNYTICRAAEFEPVEAATVMRGLYSYMADLGMFMDCSTGERYPVAMEKASAELERAYLNAEHGVAEPLIVRFEGYVTTRPAVEGSKMDKVVVVKRFLGISEAKSCRESDRPTVAQRDSKVSVPAGKVENIRWELIEIAGEPVVPASGLPVPGFRLNPQGNSLRGFGGCNRIMGSYTIRGDQLRFGHIVTTRKFCQQTQGLEDRFVQALGQVKSFRVNGNILELYGDYGLLARLKAADSNNNGL